jgi:hypothetical protein
VIRWLGHLEVRRIDLRIVAIGASNGGAKLIGHRDLGDASEVFEAANGRVDEVACTLRERRFRVRVVAGPKHHHEELDGHDLARLSVDQARLLARVVDEDLVAGAMVCLMMIASFDFHAAYKSQNWLYW